MYRYATRLAGVMLIPFTGRAMEGSKPIRFGSFEADFSRRRLRKQGIPVKIQDQPLKILAALLECPGEVVSREELIKLLWPDGTYVDYDRGLNAAVNRLRQALSDSAEKPRYVETVARHGYRFIALVEPAVDAGLNPVREVTVSAPRRWAWAAAAGTSIVIGVAIWFLRTPVTVPRPLEPLPLTSFADSAVAPALSPDGRMIAFFRSDDWFLTRGEIYVKLLPNGEPVQVTRDPRPKYGLAFSPDGSRIAYTVLGQEPPYWNTFTVSAMGGESTLFLSNAAGLTWLEEHRLLFSELGRGLHMGIVTATETRSGYRSIYSPRPERGMAHFSYASPDRKWALVVEMNPAWQPCRLVPLDGTAEGHQVGPAGKCTSAAWSPNGKWMYFGAEVEGRHRLWRQRFPNGVPEQITFGPTEADGLAVSQDGRSLITSLGLRQNSLWIHDARGERPVSSEGDVRCPVGSGWSGSSPRFTPDGKSLLYLRSESVGDAGTLWRADLTSGRNESLAPGFSMTEYDVGSDGNEVVFTTQPPGKASQLWLGTLDRRARPKLIASSGELSPYFGPDGQVLFRLTENNSYYLARMRKDGSHRAKVIPFPVANIHAISPDRRWVAVSTPSRSGSGVVTVAVPVGGGEPRRICPIFCRVAWTPEGRFLYVGVRREAQRDHTIMIPLPAGQMLPVFPRSGIRSAEDLIAFPGGRLVDAEGWLVPGPDPSVFAYVKTTVHRNLYRIPLGTR